MTSRRDYEISEKAVRQLEDYVAKLKANPVGQRVGSIDFSESSRLFDKDLVVRLLPNGLTENDLIGILRLALLSEAGAEAYAKAFFISSENFDASWLGSFTEEVWLPDEREHSPPLMALLLNFGFSEADLNAQVAEVQAMNYEHTSGLAPVSMTAFSVVLEHITQTYYGLAARLFEGVSPQAAQKIRSVGKREGLHKTWQRDLTRMQILDNPELVHVIADTSIRFRMPGEQVIPDLQQKSIGWIGGMGGNSRKIEKGLVQAVSGSLDNNPALLGRFLVEHGVRRASEPWKTPLRTVAALSRSAYLGAGLNMLLGQTIWEREGMRPQTEDTRRFWDGTAFFRKILVSSISGFDLLKYKTNSHSAG